MLPEWTNVGFSGHRKLANPAVVATGIASALDRLAVDFGHLAVIASAASGSDTLFLEEAERRQLPIRLVLPFPKKRFEEDFSPAEWQRVVPLIDKALFIEEIAGPANDDEAYLETGIVTVERAEILIFVWDRKPAAGMGGTGDVVEYARAFGKPLLIIDPETGAITEEGFNPAAAKKLKSERDENPRTGVQRHFDELDKAADREAPRARHLTILIILLQLFAAAVGILGFGDIGTLGLKNWAAGLEVVILVGAAFLAIKHHRSKYEWMQNRVGAELCRSFLATWSLKRRSSFFPTMVITGFEDLSRSLRIAWYLDKSAAVGLEEARVQYMNDRVLDQIKFYKGRGRRARSAFKSLTLTASTASVLGLSFSVLAFFFADDWIHKFAVWLPLVNAAMLSMVVSQEHARRRILYDEMIKKLESSAKRLEVVRTWPSLFRIVMETENQLLGEVIEWHAFVRFAGERQPQP
ncbi:MAG TPA: hypothetical protein VH255_05585 [Verrucomicrobiae bacterium]|jgi:hypothetical protein|nr:hypothetical protein [Verrucomicrobiae bacterium]